MIEPYISLKGQAGEALKLYQRAFNCSDFKIFRLSDMPEDPNNPLPVEMKNLIGIVKS